jgi:hypothetical protein
MSEYQPPSEQHEFDALFDSIVQNFDEERRDPRIEKLLEDAARIEVELNARDASQDFVFECIDKLNELLVQTKLRYADILYTGKLRPELRDDSKQGIDTPVHFDGLSEPSRDEHSVYFDAKLEPLLWCEFSFRTESEADGNEQIRLAILLNVDTPDDEEYLYALLDDITLISLKEASVEKKSHDIERSHPIIAKQLHDIPDSCEDDNRIVESLHSFTLHIDWSLYRDYSKSDKSNLLDAIEDAITKRAGFDTDRYVIGINGDIYIEDSEGDFTPIPCTTSRTATIDALRLNSTGKVGDIEHFDIEFEVSASGADRGSPDDLIYIPAKSIEWLQNLRNSGSASGERPVPTSPLHHNAAHDTSAAAPLFESSPTATEREHYLENIQHLWDTLIADAHELTTVQYSSEEEAFAAATNVHELVLEFCKQYPTEDTIELMAGGPGVLYMPAYFEQAEEGDATYGTTTDDVSDATVNVHGLYVAQGTIHTPMRGKFSFQSTSRVRSSQTNPDMYAVDSMVLFTGTDAEPSVEYNSALGFPMYELLPRRTFIVELNKDKSNISIPELEKLRRCREGIGKIAIQFDQAEYLPWQLTELQHAVAQANDPIRFTDIDAHLLATIGDTVKDDHAISSRTADILADILKDRMVEVSGEAYDLSGDVMRLEEVSGLVLEVMSAHMAAPAEEPLLYIGTAEGERILVPLSRLERFKC